MLKYMVYILTTGLYMVNLYTKIMAIFQWEGKGIFYPVPNYGIKT
jgi:hypothetical protein